MDQKAQHLLIQAVETAFGEASVSDDPKAAFCQSFIKEVQKIREQGLITEAEMTQYINSREQIFLSAIQQMQDFTPHTVQKGMKTSVQMFGPQFMIDPELRNRLINELGHAPVWAVVSTFGTDTLYAQLTLTEAIHRAQIEALEPGREASVVLRLDHFTGPPLFGD